MRISEYYRRTIVCTVHCAALPQKRKIHFILELNLSLCIQIITHFYRL